MLVRQFILVLSALLGLSVVAEASDSSSLSNSSSSSIQTSYSPLDVRKVAKGWRFSVASSSVTGRLQGRQTGASAPIEASNAFGIGYIHVRDRRPHMFTNLYFSDLNDSLSSARWDGGVTLGLGRYVFLTSGINASQFFDNDPMLKIDYGFGYQAGIGIQVTKRFGTHIRYIETFNSGEIAGDGGEFLLNGIEAGLQLIF